MASFSKGTSFTDGVTGDVTAAKLHALVDAATPVAGLVTDRTAETSVASGDQVLIADASDSNALKKMTVTNLFKTDVSITSGTGTAGTVAIGPTGDTNTGIFFPAADTIAFAEGGAEAMRIDSSGGVGIGTTTPTSDLQNTVASTARGLVIKNTRPCIMLSDSDDPTYNSYLLQTDNDLYLVNTGSGDSRIYNNGVERLRIDSSGNVTITSTGVLGYGAGSGGTVTQATSRTTGVTLNKTNGAITLVSAAGTTTWQSFTVTNSTVSSADVIIVSQKSGTDLYEIHVTAVSAGSFRISYRTTGGTTTEQPVFTFAVINASTS